MSLNSSTTKRRRSNDDDSPESALPTSSLDLPPVKRPRQHEAPAYLTCLSDELFLRIASYLATKDLASFQRVSRRCQRIAVDSQVWRPLYHQRFVRSRPPGQSRPAVTQTTTTDWKDLYKLKHNWSRGSCVVREVDITEEVALPEIPSVESSSASSPAVSTLVKLHEEATRFRSGVYTCGGIQDLVFTADAVHGLRAWRLRGSQEHLAMIVHGDNFIAGQSLPEDSLEEGFGAPTIMVVDGESDVRVGGKANLTLGFSGGAFVMYQLDMTDPNSSIFRVRYQHQPSNSSRNGPEDRRITALESLGPFLSIMQRTTWTLYYFSPGLQSVDGPGGPTASGPAKRSRMISNNVLLKPKILATLQSASVWPPIALSIRRSVNQTILAAIVYSYPLYVSGWSVGIQELRFGMKESGEMAMVGSRIATAVAAGFTPVVSTTRTNPGTWVPGFGPWSRSQLNDPPLSRPTSLSYSHPYLLSSHTDNTLTLYMVRSTDTALTVDQGQRLWGHTSAVEAVQLGGRGKAISISAQGMELRVWELEGGVSDRRRINASVKIEPVSPYSRTDSSVGSTHATMTRPAMSQGILGGFDDEKVVLLRKRPPTIAVDTDADEATTSSATTTEDSTSAYGLIEKSPQVSLVVYDFTR